MRSFGKRLGPLLMLVAGPISSLSGAEIAVNPDSEKDIITQDRSRMAWWRDAKFGLFLHWGPVSLTGKELSWSRKGPRPSDHRGGEAIDREEYDALYKRFNPTEFDARQWVEIAKSAGMRYLVFTTKHHDGFSNFHTQHSAHSIANSPFRRDIVKELADACHSAGMRFGVYYSTRDWYHPDYLQGDNSKYNEFFHGQVRELLTNYGKVDILWFDHVGGNWRDWKFPELYNMVRQLQPQIVINNRGAAFVHPPTDKPTPEIARLVHGDFDTPEQTLGRFNTARAWESCITLVGGQWSYKPEGKMYTLPECIGMLVECVTGDGNLLLNVGPMPTGAIEPRQVERLKEIGQWLSRYGESVYGTRGGPWPSGTWGGSTRKGSTIYLHVLRWDAVSMKLPPLKERIVRHRLLSGGQAQVEQTETGVTIRMPVAQRHPIDTILALDLEGHPALTVLSPLNYQVFQRRTRQEGQVHVHGRVNGDCDSVLARLTGRPFEGDLDTQWQAVSLNARTREFQGSLKVPAGGWYRMELQAISDGQPFGQAVVEHFGVGEVFVVAGQSNATNCGSEKQKTRTEMVASFDGLNWHIADDPQRGVQDGSQGGSFLPAFGDALFTRFKVPVGVASVGCGATSVRQWLKKGEKIEILPTVTAFVRTIGPKQWEAEGTLFDGLMKRIHELGVHGFRAVLWHQGESDAGQARAGYPADRQITGQQYRRLMEKLIRDSQDRAGWKVPWFVAQATYHSPNDRADAEFREAQKSLWLAGVAHEGPDTDALTEPYRDGVHFNGEGLQAHGRMWAEKVGIYLDRVLE